MDVPDPDVMPRPQRRALRTAAEELKFDPEHYMYVYSYEGLKCVRAQIVCMCICACVLFVCCFVFFCFVFFCAHKYLLVCSRRQQQARQRQHQQVRCCLCSSGCVCTYEFMCVCLTWACSAAYFAHLRSLNLTLNIMCKSIPMSVGAYA